MSISGRSASGAIRLREDPSPSLLTIFSSAYVLTKKLDDFETAFPNVTFIDPTRNMKWYASKLVEKRRHFDLKHSVV